ncbi:sugar transferase [Pseudonocardia sp. NPDC049635]|uniref:sugar transferase n=1 Tax=Pseudonocardia sp. NPDC049635 TaxID=3155506 RepID=UPI0033D8C122
MSAVEHLRGVGLSLPEPESSADVTERNESATMESGDVRRPRGGRIRAWMVVGPVDGLLLLSPLLWAPEQAGAIIAMALLSLYLLFGRAHYRARLHLSVLDELPSVVGTLLFSTAVVATVTAVRSETGAVLGFLENAAVAAGLVILGRVLVTQVIRWSRIRGYTRHRTVVIGGGAVAADLCRVLGRDRRYGLEVVGFVDDGSDCPAERWVPRLGSLAELESVVYREGTRVLIVADGELSETELVEAVRTPECVGCDLLVVPRLHHFQTQAVLPDHIGSIPIMRIKAPTFGGPARWVKRLADIVVAGGLIVLVLPVLALCALAVRIEGGPGVIFRQRRVGQGGREFDCLKFRSMRPVDESESATQWSIAQDDRVGRVGRILRRTSLDELPQLYNILRGDMSLVGPRPERPHFVSRFSAEFDRYAYRHRVRAGLTGLAQVNGLRGDTSIADRARYDNYYIENWSLWLDFKILVRTFAEVLFARGR